MLLGVILLVACQSFAQERRMLVEGTIRVDVGAIPTTAMLDVLRGDSSVAKVISLNTITPESFGVRLSTREGFQEGEQIAFRLRLASGDSTILRFAGPSLIFRGTSVPTRPRVEQTSLFRNHPPEFRRVVPDSAINEAQPFSYRVFARDLDVDTVVFRIVEGPAGSTIDPIGGTFHWIPSFDDAGIHRVVIEASDGYEPTLMRMAKIRVKNVNRPPGFLVAPSHTTVREGERLALQFIAEDLDGDEVNYFLQDSTAWLSIDAETGNVSGHTDFDHAGTYVVVVAASDGSLVTHAPPCTVTVLNVNRPPVLAHVPTDTVIDEGTSLSLRILPIDPDGDSVSVVPLVLPEGAVWGDEGLIHWTPDFAQSGVHSIVVEARDAESVSRFETRLTVRNVNRVPLPVKMVFPRDGETVRLEAGRPLTFTWTRSWDEDADDTIRYTVSLIDENNDTLTVTTRDTMTLVSIGSGKGELLKSFRWIVSSDDGWTKVSAIDGFTFEVHVVPSALRPNDASPPVAYALEHHLAEGMLAQPAIHYALPERSFIKLSIHNMLGEQVRTILAENREAGHYDTTFDASRLASGVYLVKLEAHPLAGTHTKDFVSTKKMVLVR